MFVLFCLLPWRSPFQCPEWSPVSGVIPHAGVSLRAAELLASRGHTEVQQDWGNGERANKRKMCPVGRRKAEAGKEPWVENCFLRVKR